ncbi:MAG: hypothetical protein ACFFG0_12290 [Candidatus Thorarchaeota archaeon]
MSEEKELICYSIGAIGKTLYDKIVEAKSRIIKEGTNSLPFDVNLDIRNGGKRFVMDIAIQCLNYLLDNKG